MHPSADSAHEHASREPLGAFARELLTASDKTALAATIERHVMALDDCQDAQVVWSLRWPYESCFRPQRTSPPASWMALADSAVSQPDWTARSAAGQDLAIGLCVHPEGSAAFLFVRRRDGAAAMEDDPAWAELLTLARSQMTILLEKARLQAAVEQLGRSEKLQCALFAISDMAGSDLDMPEMLSGLHRIVSGLMYAENFYIALYEPARDAIRFIYYIDVVDKELPALGEWIPLQRLEHGLTWYLIHDKRPLMGSLEQMRAQVSGPLRILGADCADWMGVPVLHGSEVRGAVVVQSYQERVRFTASDQALLSFVASHILTALERKQGKEELEHRVAQRTRELADANCVLSAEVEERQRGERLQAALFRIAELSGAGGSMEDFYGAIHAVVGSLINANNFYIALLSEDGNQIDFPYFVDDIEPPPPPRSLLRGVTEYVMRRRKPLLANEADFEQLIRHGEIDDLGTHSLCWLGVPLNGSDGVMGVVAVQSYTSAVVYSGRDQELLTFVSNQIAHSLEHRRAAHALSVAHSRLELRVEERTRELRHQIEVREQVELQLKHQVMHDALTGLPNRIYLRDRLDRALPRLHRDCNRCFAVLYMDVDRFKIINDSLGHQAGDDVLKEIAVQLTASVREPDVVARLGGDEFAILIEDAPLPDTVVRVAQRVIEALAAPLLVFGKELHVSVSIGIALSDDRYHTANDMLRDADTAMYRAKANGRNRFEIFDERLHREVLDVLELEGDLRKALARQEFAPHFQPIVRLASGEIVGYEALMRWQHPSRGLLGPAAFLRVAEDDGSIEAIDWWMYELSCRQAATLTASGVYISLNVSPRHFRRADFDQRLIALIRGCNVDPRRIRIEVTEGSLLDNPDQVCGILERLGQAGVLAALDDFGTGYSSLSYLHRFPLRMLKVDRSFVAELGIEGARSSASVVRAILALARSLEMDVVAEGIETAGQRDVLIRMGCEFGQGFLFAHPHPATATAPCAETV